MCSTCGCSTPGNENKITDPNQKDQVENLNQESFQNQHHHYHNHSHPHGQEVEHILQVEQDILGRNNLVAQRNRGYFEAKNIFALNLVSSPGSGKTSILEATLRSLKDELTFAVIEGDQQTTQDADRINALNVPVRQINTGKGCHLDSEMVYHAFRQMNLDNNSFLMIENVGNLVCPAMFDLGENSRVVIISTTEGDDKPLKYPDMFSQSDVCIINKIDLLPYVQFDVETVRKNAMKINHHLEFFEISATTGEGMNQWFAWLKAKLEELQICI